MTAEFVCYVGNPKRKHAYVQCQKERFSVGNLVTSVGASKIFFPCHFKVSSVFLEVSEKDF